MIEHFAIACLIAAALFALAVLSGLRKNPS
jgi:hypothetical protein